MGMSGQLSAKVVLSGEKCALILGVQAEKSGYFWVKKTRTGVAVRFPFFVLFKCGMVLGVLKNGVC